MDRGIIEAMQAVGASVKQTVLWALLPEAMPGIMAGITVTSIALVSFAAMSGVVGGGGLGGSRCALWLSAFFVTDVMIVYRGLADRAGASAAMDR